MPNITLSVDADVIRKVRKIAVDKNTTLTALVREYLEHLAERDDAARKRAVADLAESFAKLSRNMGPHDWTREELHER